MISKQILLDEELRVTLHTFIRLALDDPAEIVTLDREVTLGTKRVGHAFKITRPGLS